MKTHSATLKKKSFRLHLCHQIICFLSLYCLHLFQCKCFYQSYWLQNFAPLNLKRKRKKVPWLSQYVILTYLTAASTLDFVTARVRAALMGLNMNHCVTAVPVVILKMNHGPCTLDLRDTSIINLWKRRQEREKTWEDKDHLIGISRMSFFFSTYTHVSGSLSARVWWSQERQFHSSWSEPPQPLQLHYFTPALVCCAHLDTHNSALRSAASFAVALNVTLHDNGGNKSYQQLSSKQEIILGNNKSHRIMISATGGDTAWI